MKRIILPAVFAASLLTYNAVAQDQTPPSTPPPADQGATPGGNQGGGRGNRGNFDPAQFQQRVNDRIKQALKATDDEWAVIQPLLQKVQEDQRAAGGRGMGGFGRRGQGGPGGEQGGNQNAQGGNNNRPPLGGGSPEAEALAAALQNDSTSPDEIKAKLTALRDARKKAQASLETDRAELAKVLTARQEATLVLMGVLE